MLIFVVPEEKTQIYWARQTYRGYTEGGLYMAITCKCMFQILNKYLVIRKLTKTLKINFRKGWKNETKTSYI